MINQVQRPPHEGSPREKHLWGRTLGGVHSLALAALVLPSLSVKTGAEPRMNQLFHELHPSRSKEVSGAEFTAAQREHLSRQLGGLDKSLQDLAQKRVELRAAIQGVGADGSWEKLQVKLAELRLSTISVMQRVVAYGKGIPKIEGQYARKEEHVFFTVCAGREPLK